MASGVDARLLKSTKFPTEFNQKVDMQKVNIHVIKKWIASRISEILGNEDDVIIELCFALIEGARNPDIKSLQIQLTGFLEKDTATFCKELWKLLLSAQSSPQGVPKELLEAKKLELMQEKADADRSVDDTRRRRDQDDRRARDFSDDVEGIVDLTEEVVAVVAALVATAPVRQMIDFVNPGIRTLATDTCRRVVVEEKVTVVADHSGAVIGSRIEGVIETWTGAAQDRSPPDHLGEVKARAVAVFREAAPKRDEPGAHGKDLDLDLGPGRGPGRRNADAEHKPEGIATAAYDDRHPHRLIDVGHRRRGADTRHLEADPPLPDAGALRHPLVLHAATRDHEAEVNVAAAAAAAGLTPATADDHHRPGDDARAARASPATNLEQRRGLGDQGERRQRRAGHDATVPRRRGHHHHHPNIVADRLMCPRVAVIHY
ncbi:uncharacterized protein F5Z01DRAFT_633807 [Emericellopsis atlantica]|uniref:PWI domain-containing protein n=1 Tax=Emericellopsis atlantica TaxID=2614577 RepID=A0A9P7ZSH5_9HYPO|nr:uncharacterized protein F5Z01DRAFT_633807 [Emericellopsis atlantica]KAG9257032.1 hypothetical protein F5Z01DRAFT_633807 [Emericellopsis atlantica]